MVRRPKAHLGRDGRLDLSLAGGLVRQYGLRAGDRVAILDKNSDAYLELLFALDKAGAVAVPLNWRFTANEVAAMVRRAVGP